MTRRAEFEAAKLDRLTWLAQLYSHDSQAASEEAANEHLFDRFNDFGIEHFLKTFRPLVRLRERRGPVVFALGRVVHEADDLTYAELCVADEVIYIARVRFEEVAPCRIRYWSSYPPLPDGVTLRPYTPADSSACVALERLCPFESADGTRWTLDRGDRFDDCLALMRPIDAWVAEAAGVIVGFFSCALRPIRMNGEACYAVYQHHYRVHPDHRAGSISIALASYVDPRRSFDGLPVAFPYSMIDPNNLHMQNVGFPAVGQVQLARLSLSVEKLRQATIEPVELTVLNPEQIIALLDRTHGQRVLYPDHDLAYLQARWNRVGDFDEANYRGMPQAFAALWNSQERNRIEREGRIDDRCLAFVLDYGFENPGDLLRVLATQARQLTHTNTTHIGLLCDTRAEEYAPLSAFADDEALLAVHTLPWICEPLHKHVIYCDGIYF